MGNYLRGKRGTQRRTGTIKAKGVEQFRGESGHDADDAVKSGKREIEERPLVQWHVDPQGPLPEQLSEAVGWGKGGE